MPPKHTAAAIKTISLGQFPGRQQQNGMGVSTHRVAAKAVQRGPIVAVIHDQTDGIDFPSWVFIAESGAKTRLALVPRSRRARSALNAWS
jgi:hypothetical protein